jgi:hypothetical protein
VSWREMRSAVTMWASASLSGSSSGADRAFDEAERGLQFGRPGLQQPGQRAISIHDGAEPDGQNGGNSSADPAHHRVVFT